MRAMRVVVDIGMHLELTIPSHEHYHPGETWTPDLALPFMIRRSRPEKFMRSEVDLSRLAGAGHQLQGRRARVWLECRAGAKQRGAAFGLKAFHTCALDLGGMGLGPCAKPRAVLEGASRSRRRRDG
jgi:uncharacterized protein (DUF885 family)